jgi:hypothetical protein
MLTGPDPVLTPAPRYSRGAYSLARHTYDPRMTHE